MTVCLYECLRAAGLQHHYDRFTLVGVCRAAHLSSLKMEDYSLLGVHSMEDRTRLFHLVQLVKTLDLKSLLNDDVVVYNENVYDGGDEDYSAVDGRFSPDGYGNPDEDLSDNQDENKASMGSSSFAGPSHVRRRLEFTVESSHPAQHNKNGLPVHGNESATPMQHTLLSRRFELNGHRESKTHKFDVHKCLHDCQNEEKLHIKRGPSVFNYDIRLLPNSKTSHKHHPSPVTVTSKTINNKSLTLKERKVIYKRKIYSTGMTKPIPVYEAKRTAGYNYGLPLTSPRAPNNKYLGGQRISVCVRKRPLTRAECRRREADVVTTPAGDCVVVHESKEAVDLTEYILQHRFYFDHVFGEESSNEEVYQKTVYPLVQHMLSGGKATCFAYGQTGAGKTYTMLGSCPGRPGLYALAVQDIFAHLSATHSYCLPQLVYVSFFEIYCGQLYDLLDHRKRVFAREDRQKMVHISGLCNVRVDSVSSLLEVISQGTAERTQGMSGVNPLSSRSHALLQIQLRDLNQQTTGRMCFVDLAGSERASDAKEPDRQTRMEGAEINQSLLALKECIRSLDREESHTPFRQSKLTQGFIFLLGFERLICRRLDNMHDCQHLTGSPSNRTHTKYTQICRSCKGIEGTR
ncbi:kinesin-like protein KIF24 isoform X2 [Kryptolebias marmoratus]|uniref:kinesin-like protein KIF24 isoform X2 n=1 Tax=Kryptolebias marmoratus TaxID=37003 RepID=UPI0007F8A0BD|nr:kinesin-like protein KIF24 isoform X2 [Kryptolebias marmoratus]